MPAPKENKYAVGNKGGCRKGYEFEDEQLQKMRQHFNWLLAYVDAVRKGKATGKQHKAFERLERVLLKMMDKLHANRQHTEITGDADLPFIIKIVKGDRDTNEIEKIG